jgi:YegS/Rv2252/BmrU family lipid kinase
MTSWRRDVSKSSANAISNVLVVLNPVAGNVDAAQIRRTLERDFSKANWSYEIYTTTGEERLADVVRAHLAPGIDAIVAAGGDGTVSGVVDGLARTEIPLGIIPVGTGNTLARDLGIPLEPKDALNLLTGAHEFKGVDAIRVDDCFFVLNVSVGISSLTMRHTAYQQKRHFGFLAYIWQGVRWLIGLQPRRFTVVTDGEATRTRASEVVVANSRLIGAPPFGWGDHVVLDDGRLDVCLVHARTAPNYIGLGANILLGRPRQDPHIRYLSAKHSIRLETDRPLPVQGDGDVFGQTPLRVEVEPCALKVIVPGKTT